MVASAPSTSYFTHLSTIKLSSDNFLLWKDQITPLAWSQGYTGHLDGSNPAPPVTIKASSDGQIATAIDYDSWLTKGQFIIVRINSILSPEILAQVLDIPIAHQLWISLYDSYAQQSEAHLIHLRQELQNCCRGSQSIQDYLTKLKNIFDQLAIIQQPLDEVDKTHYVLNGLGGEYKMFVTYVISHPPLLKFNDL